MGAYALIRGSIRHDRLALTSANSIESSRRRASFCRYSCCCPCTWTPAPADLFDVTKWQFITLACHLCYSSSMYLVLRRGIHIDSVRKFSIALDLLFATALAFVTEGRTSPSFVLFVFAIVAGGLGASLRDTVLTTSCSVLLYILVIAFSNGLTSDYLMRAVYLAMAGFVIGFFGTTARQLRNPPSRARSGTLSGKQSHALFTTATSRRSPVSACGWRAAATC